MSHHLIWVRVPDHRDPALIGKEILRKPWTPHSAQGFFTREPELVERTPEIERFLHGGELIECEPGDLVPGDSDD